MRFILEIKLGNDAMQSGTDVAEALEETARKLHNRYDGLTLPAQEHGVIFDANGNNVGEWSVAE